MEFKDLDEAIEYIKTIENEKNDLQQQFDNQKVIIEKNNETQINLNKEIERLKIANYELYQKIDVSNGVDNDNHSKQQTIIKYTIDDLIKDMD